MVLWTEKEETKKGDLGLVQRETRRPILRPRDWEKPGSGRRELCDWHALDIIEETTRG